ncbi:hypothetical protein Q9233_016267, partial [Columba guinea]
ASPAIPMDALSAVTVALAALLLAVAAALAALAHRLGLLHQLLHPVGCTPNFLPKTTLFHPKPRIVRAEVTPVTSPPVSQVDPRSPRHGGELVAAVLKAHGVRFVFALAGGHISPILVACEKIGVRVVDTRHEATAVFAADAVSRLSGGVGVAIVTAGPGVTNTITAVKNAQLAESPLLLIGGAAATLQKGRGALQDVEQLSLFRTLCKARVSVRTVRDLVPSIRQAMATARSGTPRYGTPKCVFWAQVQRCAELLSRARKPLVLLGSQAMLPPTTPAQLCSALESLGIPCYLGGASRGLLPPDSPILLRQNRRDALRDADLVLLAGAVCDFRLSYGRLFNRGAAVVAVNRDREQLLKNSDVFWKPRLAVQAIRCHSVTSFCPQPGPFGTLGVGGGFALGAKLCRPDAEVWVLYGDGSLGYSLMEFDTFVRHKTPVIALVGNDACWSQIAREQVALLGSNVACGLAYL